MQGTIHYRIDLPGLFCRTQPRQTGSQHMQSGRVDPKLRRGGGKFRAEESRSEV